MKKRWQIALLALVLFAAGGWVWGSPYYTLWQMKHAAEARDIDALARHIDFPMVRESVKAQLSARTGAEGGGVLGALVRAGIADTVVDAAVSPEGMRFIFAAAPLAETPRPDTIKLKANEMRYRRVAFGRFLLTRKDGAALEFRLHGANWVLTDLRLPPDAFH
ncbi:DUF2939 domain-containing protein [Nostoc ellipsosporum NOK]|uniref:DUF2939 domain-containing protein n=1 Tax=Sphingomonas sp. IBVSS2 TaxID=1985172 RepID=UPI000A2E9A2F|nr:DUF2939 domain-containing protein [Sphingomonas sp. IBVSS2]MDF2387395.1 DUF2939 domain-containing protein [Nostoc ellipsosporum NOK]OSZ66678.1 hypothetical protein CAP40_12515 [Sphingomonas sp. IBVSS2]